MSDRPATHKVRFKYEFANDYRIIHATGAVGGITPSGNLKLDLFTEFGPSPDNDEWTLNPDGTLDEQVVPTQAPEAIEVIRQKQAGVIIGINEVENIAKWLLEKVKEAKELGEARRKTKNKKE